MLPQTTKLVLPYTPKHPHSHEQKLEYLDHLFLRLMDTFMVGHTLKKLSMDFPMIDGVFVPTFRTITFISLKLEASTPNLFTSLDFRPFTSDGEQMMLRLRYLKTNLKHGNNGIPLCLHLSDLRCFVSKQGEHTSTMNRNSFVKINILKVIIDLNVISKRASTLEVKIVLNLQLQKNEFKTIFLIKFHHYS